MIVRVIVVLRGVITLALLTIVRVIRVMPLVRTHQRTALRLMTLVPVVGGRYLS